MNEETNPLVRGATKKIESKNADDCEAEERATTLKRRNPTPITDAGHRRAGGDVAVRGPNRALGGGRDNSKRSYDARSSADAHPTTAGAVG